MDEDEDDEEEAGVGAVGQAIISGDSRSRPRCPAAMPAVQITPVECGRDVTRLEPSSLRLAPVLSCRLSKRNCIQRMERIAVRVLGPGVGPPGKRAGAPSLCPNECCFKLSS